MDMNKGYAVIDIETTGLNTTDEITQVAMFILDSKMNPVSFRNYYFTTTEPLSQEVKNVTGFTDEFLLAKSGGQFFVNCKDKVLSGLDDKIIVAHNASFEKKMFKAWAPEYLTNNEWLCTMKRYSTVTALPDRKGKGGIKYVKLSELVAFVLREKMPELNPDERLATLNNLFTKITKETATFHDALFDTFATTYCLNYLG